MYELLASLTALAGLLIYIRLVANARKRRREQVDDDDVDYDDWEYGSPDDPVPEHAKPFKTDV